MTDTERIAELERTVRVLWGAMLAAKLTAPDNRFIAAAFDKADAECRKTGLLANEGVRFIEQEA